MIPRPPRSTLFPYTMLFRSLLRRRGLLLRADPRQGSRGDACSGLPEGDRLERGAEVWRDVLGLALLRSEEHTSELQSLTNLVCRLLLEKKKERNTLQHDL